MHTFQIVTTNDRDLGLMELGRPRLADRERDLPRAGRSRTCVVERRDTHGAAVLVVEEL